MLLHVNLRNGAHIKWFEALHDRWTWKDMCKIMCSTIAYAGSPHFFGYKLSTYV